MKRLVSVILTFAVILFVSGGSLNEIAASAATVNATSIKIYELSEWAEEFISIPSSYPQSYQLTVSGASNATYRIKSGDAVNVSSEGLITPRYTTWYWNGNVGSSWSTGQPGERVEVRPNFGTSVIEVIAGSQTFEVTAELADYAVAYTDEQIDKYIAENITADLSGEEKLKAAAKYAASFDYSVYYSSAAGMVISGGGDCWASTSLIIKMCEKMGIEAWARNGNKDPGAGSGHENVMAYVDGEYYEVDAGYVGDAPRYYSINKRNSLFSYSYLGDNRIEIYQYDGKTMPEKLEIPSKIGDYTVVGLGSKFITLDNTLKEIVLPSTLEYISDSAFNSCYELVKINIPASLTSIGKYVFTSDTKLTEITCEAGNEYFSAQDGVLYDKNKTTLLYAPAVSSVTIPSTVTTIATYSFYHNSNLKSIVIPESVKTIEEGAFCYAQGLSSVTINGNSLETIGNYVFAETPLLTSMTLPRSVKSIGNAAIGYSNYSKKDFTLYGYSDTAAETYASEYDNITFVDLDKSYVLTVDTTVKGSDDTNEFTLTVEDSLGNSYPTSVSSNGTFSVNDVLSGDYTFTFSAPNCAPRKYDVTISEGNVTSGLEDGVELHLYGDINGDGTLDIRDVSRANANAKNVTNLSGYDLTVCDLNGDGVVDIRDVSRMNAHAKNVTSLWN